MITVGINQNLVIQEAKKNDKGSLQITFKEALEIDPLDALNSAGSTQLDGAKQDIVIFPINPNDMEGNTDTYENIVKKIADIKDPLDHILQQYTTKSNIKWDIFKGTDISAENIKTEVRKETVQLQIYNNIVDQFIKMLSPYLDESKKMRVLFVRQSAAKHYPRLRTRYIDRNPFMEPMSVPAEQSKLVFSKYEKDKGLDKGEPVVAGSSASVEDKQTADTLFQ